VLILRGKRLGFSLREIRDWLELYDTGLDQTEQIKRLLALTRERLTTLEAQYNDLEATIDELREIEADAVDHLKANNGSDEVVAEAAATEDSKRRRGKR
jgi:DNA-binding transcriptional MerR regulator